ncbi:Putative mitochondrial carrier domain superfamily [Septoria linicola]|uniref:Mitochondrial carrier domain superfamily n=1 Tax=Septoria linicola TaxID=215465 RepID=A0A9Q9EIJ5_9PEZI|nr:putative mitochondrial carrier domain superfamily [Septoria linicola]USW52095.1 Putative mitochondrial carrier domain superfamily [Septoria linicola]
MSGKANGFFAYNSQLVSSFYNQVILLNGTEFTPEDAFTLYHLTTEEQHGARLGADVGPILPALGHAIAGGLASALSKAVVYPIDTIVTRMQVQRQLKGDKEAPSAASNADAEYKSPTDAANKIYKNEGGLKAFYAGLNSDVVKHIADSFLFFLAYNAVRDQMLKRQGGKQLPVLKELSVGVLAGALSKAVTQPISNIVVRQQTAALVAARDPSSLTTPGSSDKLSVKDIALQIRNEKGIAGFWSGYSAQLILTLNPAITFAVDNLLKGLVPKDKRDNASATFLVAALSKVVATSITYPVMLAKSRAQASRGSSDESDPSEHYVSVNDNADRKTQVKQAVRRVAQLLEGQTRIYVALKKIYRNEGVAGLYSGLEGEVVKGFLQHGLTMAAKDGVHVGVVQLYYIVLKLTKRWDEELAKAQEQAQELAKDAAQRVENVAVSAAEAAKRAVGQ